MAESKRHGKKIYNITARQRSRRIAAELLQIEKELKSSPVNTLSQNFYSNSVSPQVSSITPFKVTHNYNSGCISSDVLDNLHSNSIISNISNTSLDITNVTKNLNSNAASVHIATNILKNSNNFKDFLRNWAVQENINASSLNKLLHGFADYGLDTVYGLPLDSRTLLNTPRSTYVKQVDPGFYSHLGIELGILESLKTNLNKVNSSIQILINIDGLPISKSGSSELWPILGLIYKTNQVFLIGLYHGCQKPCDIFAFLEDFVKEATNLINSGISYLGKTYSFSINGFCADAPAKAMILNVKYHSGYSSCTKCNIVGDYLERRVCFSDYIGQKRSDKSFADHIDEDYHQGTSPLENIPKLGLVSQVPLDYQHLVCLGIVKKMLLMWNFGNLSVRIPYHKVKLISWALIHLVKDHIPAEFQRKPRALSYVRKWKATEYRQLLLYSGPIVLKNILNNEVYDNFITLHVAISILSSKRYCYQPTWLNYAKNLLECFVKQFGIIYGKHNISYNVHGLLHLTDDVEKFGPLDYFSTFKFESFLGHLKKKLRKEDKHLQQIVRRYAESIALHDLNKLNSSSDSISDKLVLSYTHLNGPLLVECTNPQYRKLKLNDMTFINNDEKNDCCNVQGNRIVKIYNIAFKTIDDEFVVVGKEYLKKFDLYKLPCPSSTMGIYVVDDLSELMTWRIKDIQFKYFSFPICQSSTRMAVFPLLHF